MGRMNLDGWTPEARKAREKMLADARKQKQRAKEKEEREMAKKKALLTSTSPEVVEFLTMTIDYKIAALTEAIAIWEREYQQPLPIAPLPDDVSPFGPEGLRHRDLGIAKMLADGFFARQKAKERKNAFDAKEAAEAKRQGITVFELQKRRKIAAAIEAKKAREVQRLTDKIAA